MLCLYNKPTARYGLVTSQQSGNNKSSCCHTARLQSSFFPQAAGAPSSSSALRHKNSLNLMTDYFAGSRTQSQALRTTTNTIQKSPANLFFLMASFVHVGQIEAPALETIRLFLLWLNTPRSTLETRWDEPAHLGMQSSWRPNTGKLFFMLPLHS